MYKILIVEDDQIIASSVCEYLKTWGYDTEYVKDFENVMEHFLQFMPQLVIMDITLPFFNGYHWCQEIRKISKVPIIFLSSMNDNMNIVMAVNMGGDDFVAKPFDMAVLTAKVQAMLRRSYSFQGETSVCEHRGVILNLNDTTLHYGDKKLDLTKNDFKILHILFQNAEKVVSRDSIMERLWESESFIDDNTLTVNMTRLRRKLEEIGLKDFIVTKKGLGYMIS